MKKKMGVLFLQSDNQPPPFAALHRLLMRHYNREHIEVHVACTKGSEREILPSFRMLETIPGISIRQTNFGPTILRKSKIEIARSLISSGLPATVSMMGLLLYVKQHNINIIHASTMPREAVYAVSLAKLVGAKSFIHLHSKYNDWLGPRVFWSMRQADGIICVSRFVAQSLIDQGYPPSKVYQIHNGLDVNCWNSETDGRGVRQEFGVAADGLLLVIVAGIVPWKGHELLLKALVKVKDKVPNIKLLIVGVGSDDSTLTAPQGGHSYTAALKKMTHKLGLDEQVIFTGYRTDVQQIMAACDLYTMPSFEEPCAMVFLEAMVMKKPIIALDSGGTPELVEHGKSGLLSPPEDAEKLAENILTLINNPTSRQQMGEYGRTRVEQYFNAQRMAEDVERIYRLVLGGTVDSKQEQELPVEALHRR